MKEAIDEAYKAAERDEVPVGAVIVESATGKVVATAGNRMRELNDPSAHAELLAMRQACKATGKLRLEEYDMYVTLEPCPMCAQAVSFARIRRLYFGAYDTKGGGVEHGARVFEATSCHHRPEVYGGIEAEANAALLKEFFKEKRGSRI